MKQEKDSRDGTWCVCKDIFDVHGPEGCRVNGCPCKGFELGLDDRNERDADSPFERCRKRESTGFCEKGHAFVQGRDGMCRNCINEYASMLRKKMKSVAQ